MFVTPAPTVAKSPSLGFSAVTKKLWNTFCIIKAVVNRKIILPYSTQSPIIASVAPKRYDIGLINTKPITLAAAPQISDKYIIIVK